MEHICDICNEEDDDVYTCTECGMTFCTECGHSEAMICNQCAEN